MEDGSIRTDIEAKVSVVSERAGRARRGRGTHRKRQIGGPIELRNCHSEVAEVVELTENSSMEKQ